jgi:hypothetical protein
LSFVSHNRLSGYVEMKINLEKEASLTAERLRSLIAYNPETGSMTWIAPSRKNFVGKEVAKGSDTYPAVTMKGTRFLLHRLAWLHFYGEWPAGSLDHINCDPADNRISNLRLATPRQNMANQRPRRSTPKGVCKVYRGRWKATIRINGEQVYLGSFDTPAEAHLAYRERATEIYGEFARFD